MDKAIRAEMLRRSYRANGGIPFVAVGFRRPKRGPAKPKRVFSEWPQVDVNHNRTPDWLREPEHKPALRVEPKRLAHESALTSMSRKLCLKLPRIKP
jgi:hypothetical protein